MSSRRGRRRQRRQPSPSPSPQSSQKSSPDQHMDDDSFDDDNDNRNSQSQSRSQSRSNSQTSSSILPPREKEDDENHHHHDDNDNNEHDPEEEEEEEPSQPSTSVVEHDVDEDTIRILVSTDNHLGYAERDPIRGNDSFAAFEEVLLLAKRHHCDMVLLAGDLFHDNKPTRRTIHKTMNILRRYTMGPNPISFQIISNQKQNFRSTVSPHHTVNYENPYMSIDLPIFSIHGNHDDPTRDSGGDEMLAALDILAMGNLVNYFGRQDEVDKIQVSPILIKKGETNLALYGMGSMRDERLNRMWQGKKVRFLKPLEEKDQNRNNNDEDGEESEEENEWFNIFALHQNRDLGRGTKNCVHESMIPEWMDLVVWGHEHECMIETSESAVGTFRITQPGSSVATSLTEGESLPKHVGVLDVRGSQFRLRPIPLMSVRPFAMGSICLSADTTLDAEDIRVDDAMGEELAKEVEKLIEEARENSRLLNHKNGEGQGDGDGGDDSLTKQLDFQVAKPERVLVRLKVEHSGFSTLHNQRFGSRFVNEVANPSDILLFHRKRTTDESSSSSKKRGTSNANNNSTIPTDPTYPAEIDEINVEDIVRDTLDSTDKKLQILDEEKLNVAVEEFISKEQRQMIDETVEKIVNIQQKKLVKRGVGVDTSVASGENGEVKLTTMNAVREVCQAETQKIRDSQFSMDIDGEDGGDDDKVEVVSNKKKTPARKRGRTQRDESEPGDDDIVEEVAPKRSRTNGASRPSRAKPKTKTKPRVPAYKSESDFEEDDDDEIVEDYSPPKRNRSSARSGGRASRRATRNRSYKEQVIEIDDDDEPESSGWGNTNSNSQSSSSRSRRR